MGRTDLPAMYARARGHAVHEPEGVQWPRASADISGKSRSHMLHMLCNTSGTPKICRACYLL